MLKERLHTHTHTHTHIYIYIYILHYMCMIKSIELNISTYFSNKSISISYFAMFFLFFFLLLLPSPLKNHLKQEKSTLFDETTSKKCKR